MAARSAVWQHRRSMFDLAFRTGRLLPTLVLLALGTASAHAAPITAAPPTDDSARGVTWSRVSEHDIIGNGLHPGALTDIWPLHLPGEAILPDAALLESRGLHGSEARDGLGIVNAMRGLANIDPNATTPRRASSAQRPPVNHPLAGIDLGPEARQWMHDAFRGVVDSVLELDVDARGRASFSVLGMGEFGIAVSGDRNQIAFLSGDHVLFTAQRGADPTSGMTSSGGGAAGGAWHRGTTAATGWSEGSPLRKALELVLEIATHPLSLLVYLIIASYILLWNVLNRQRGTRSRSRSVRHAEGQSATSSTRRTRRRRHRVRRHRHA